MKFKIEKDVPLPSQNVIRTKYTFLTEMEVGDSVFVPVKLSAAVRTSASNYGKLHDKKYSIRKTEDGYRLWRTQ